MALNSQKGVSKLIWGGELKRVQCYLSKAMFRLSRNKEQYCLLWRWGNWSFRGSREHAQRNVTKFRERWDKVCGSILVWKQKKPVFLGVLVFTSFSRAMLEKRQAPHCSLPQLRTQTALLSATSKATSSFINTWHICENIPGSRTAGN